MRCSAGLGVLVYAACWLILPAEGENGAAAGQRGIVLLAQACGTLLGLGDARRRSAALATVFGFGWIVVAVAAAVLVGTLAGWARLGPAWALLPIGALVLPSVALARRRRPDRAEHDVGRARAAGALRPAARGAAQRPRDCSRWTCGTRRCPASGTIPLRIDAGVRRTLVALPHDRCVHVEVPQRDAPVALRVGAALLGAASVGTPGATVFGERRTTSHATIETPTPARRADAAACEFASAGGELVVRDYPDDVDPGSRPDWPGYPVLPRGAARHDRHAEEGGAAYLVREWRARRKHQLRSKKRIDRLLAGPCAAEVKR